MIFLFSLIPATALVVVGYLVIYAATRATGGLKRFGQYLGIWVFFLAGCSVLAGLFASTVGMQSPLSAFEQHMERMTNIEEEQLAMLREFFSK